MRQRHAANLLWFLAGVGLGTSIGIVLAPQAGADSRRLISSSGREYLDMGRDLYERGRHLADEAAELFEEGRRIVEEAQTSEAQRA